MRWSVRNIRCVLFDLGWTLVKPSSGDWTFTNAFQKMFPAETYGAWTEARWQQAFRKAYVPLQENPYMKDVSEQISRYTSFFRQLVKEAGYDISEADARYLAEDISCNDENMYLIETAKETLCRLKEDGCRIGVISDTWPNIESQLRYLGIDQYFDQLTYSYRLGCSKPDPAMFEDAVRKAGMPADQILFIDDLAGNLAAAEKTGMHGALSIADPRTKEDPRFPSVARPADVYHILQAD